MTGWRWTTGIDVDSKKKARTTDDVKRASLMTGWRWTTGIDDVRTAVVKGGIEEDEVGRRV